MNSLNFVFDLQRFSADPMTVPITDELKQATAGTYGLYKNGDSYKWLLEGSTVEDGYEKIAGPVVVVSGSGTTLTRTLTVTKAGLTDVVLSGVTKEDLASLAGVTVKTMVPGDNEGDPAKPVSCNISIEGIDGSINAKSLVFTSKGIVADATDVDVSADGVISNLQAKDSFSVYTSMSDKLATTYTVGTPGTGETETTLSVSGDTVGAYTGVALSGEKVATITLGANGAAATVANATAASYDDSALTLDATGVTVSTPKYYAIKLENGKLSIAQTAEAPATNDGALGYYKVTYNPNNRLNANVTVELVAADDQAAKLLGAVPVTIDATGVKTINDTAVTAITVVSGITTGKVTVDQVPTTADVTVAGQPYTANTADDNTAASITYVKSFVVAKDAALTISLANAQAGDNNYFIVNVEDANDHGKQKCSIGTTAQTTKENSQSAFKVTVDGSGDYTVEFVKGIDGDCPDLTDAGWKNIVVDANAVPVGKSLTIKSAGTDGSEDKTQDNYRVTNAHVGTTVTLTHPTTTAQDPVDDDSELKVERVANENVATTIVYDNSNSDTTDDNAITLPVGNGPTTEYWKVTREIEVAPKYDGNPTITIKKQTEKPSSTDSYIAVSKDADGNISVTYNNNAGIALTGLFDSYTDQENPVRVVLDPTGLEAGNTLNITDTDATVDYAVAGLKRGVTVAGKGTNDSIAYDTTTTVYDGAVTLNLSGVTGTKYYTVTAQLDSNNKAVVDPETGLTKLVVDEYTPGENTTTPATGTGYFTITQDADGNYTVSYNANSGVIDLSKAVGSTIINAAGVLNTANITLVNKPNSNADATVAGYKVTNVAVDGTGVIKVDATDVTNDSATVSYAETKYALAEGAAALKLHNTAATTTNYYVTSKSLRGVITYTISDTKENNTNPSYFEVSYDEKTKSAVIKFVEKENGITEKEFAQNVTDKVQVDGSALSTDDKVVTTVVLTKDSTTDGSIEYNVTGLPKNVTKVDNVGTGDTYSYTKTYQFAEDGNKIALNGAVGKIYYYEVKATGGDNKTLGVYTCTIQNGVEIAEKSLDSIKTKNYFKVVTDAQGNPTITYHKAEATEAVPNPTVLDMTGNLEVAVDPTNAGKTAVITCGSATNDNGKFKYVVNGLSKDQTAVDGDGAGTNTVEFKYNVSYTFGDSKLTLSALTSAELDKLAKGESVTKYYAVSRADGSTTTTVGKGIVKFTIDGNNALTNAPTISGDTCGAYFMVKYSSEYQVNVTYVNPTGERFDLTVDGVPQVTVDADGLSADGVKIDTINVADTTGGDYNGVNYALTNVPAGIAVVDTSKEGGVLDSKDTVSYKNIAVLAADATINLGTAAEMYYVVTAGETNDGVTSCTVNAAGTTEKPADTVNYFTAAKDSKGNYTITYHMANGEGYAFDSSKEQLKIDAANVTVTPGSSTDAEGVTTETVASVTINNSTGLTKVDVTNAPADVKDYGATLTPSASTFNSISYSTKFAWATGNYYIQSTKGTATTVAEGGESAATVPGGTATYVKVTVTKSSKGTGKDKVDTYKVALGTNYQTAGTDGTVADPTSSVNVQAGDLTLVMPEKITNLDASSVAFGAITGVTASDTLTNVNAGTVITTAELKANDVVNIGNGTEPTAFKAGAAGAITFKGTKVTDGVILLDKENAEVTESGTAGLEGDDGKKTSAVQLTTVGNGVTVTFTKGQITSIVGLEVGEQIVVTENSNKVTYGSEKVGDTTYFVRVDTNGKTYAAVPQNPAATNLMDMVFTESTTQAVGTFSTADEAVSYLDMGESSTAEFTLANQTAGGTAQAGHYYAKVTMADSANNAKNNNIASISVVKGNSAGLVDNTTEFAGTITVPAELFGTGADNGVVIYKGTPNTPYKVAFTGVQAGSAFTTMDADDTITTAELDTNKSITVNGGVYTTYSTGATKQALTFKGNALTSGTVKLADTSKLEAADGTIIEYAKSTAETSGVILVFGAKGITSITGLTNGEKVTLTAKDADGKITSTTTYTADITGATVTREVTTPDGKVVTDTLTIPVVDGNQTNILAVTETTGKELATGFTWADATTETTVGYIAKTSASGNAAGSREFDLSAATGKVNLVDGTVVIKAESQYITKGENAGKVVLTITPLVSDANGNLTATNPYGDTVKVTAPVDTTNTNPIPIIFDQSTVYKVAFTGVAAGSDITANQEGTTITTVALANGGTESIVVNGQTITTAAASAESIKLYIANTNDVRVINGTIAVDGTRRGESAATTTAAAALVDTVTYTADSSAEAGKDGHDGVIVKYVNGEANSITDLEEGEQVVVKNGKVTTTYQAVQKDPVTSGNVIIWKTVEGAEKADDNGTFVASVTGVPNVKGVTFTKTETTNSSDGDDGFSTKYATKTNVGYFLVDEDETIHIVDTSKKTAIATYQDAGKTVIKAEITSTGTLNLTKMVVSYTGKAVASNTAKVVKKATITVVSGEKISFTKDANIAEKVEITGIGKDSVIKSVTAGDTITTAKLTADDKVTIGTTTYTAGADGTMVFDGLAVKSGTFKTTASLTASTFDDETKVKTANVIKYTAGTATDAEKDGVNVKIADGMVESITGLWQGETVSYTQTVTAKDGSKVEKVITYVAGEVITSGADKGSVKVTKTETVNGDSTTYTKVFERNADITKSDWAVQSASTTSQFQFGDTSDSKYTTTGYFAATENTTVGDENKGKYSATIVKQDTAITLKGGVSTVTYPVYYLKVTATKGTAGNVTFTEMSLVALKANGVIEPVADKELYSVTLNAPKGANIKLADHEFVVDIKADGTDNSTFSNLNAADKVTATVDDGKYLTVNNKKYTAVGTNDAISVKGDTLVSGKVKVEAGNVLKSAADSSTIAFTAKDGATVDGVVAVFGADDGITSITDLEAGEIVTITAADGTVTTYERSADDAQNKSVITKTITQDGQKTVWTTGSLTTTDDIKENSINATYGVSRKFSWPTAAAKESVGYFEVDTTTTPTNPTAAIAVNTSDTPLIEVDDEKDQVIRAVVEKTDKGYTITSLKLLQGQNLKDVTATAYRKTADADEPVKYPEVKDKVTNVEVTINAPSEEGITFALADTAIVLPATSKETPDIDRNVALNIIDAKKGQVYTGLADVDKVTTVQLQADDVITVNDVAYAAAEPGALSVKGDGKAFSGGFKLASGYAIKALKNGATDTTVDVTMTSGDAMVTVVNGQVQKILKLNAGETVTVTETDKNNVVSTVTYTGSAGEKGNIKVTRTTVTDGVTTVETATIQDGEDVLGGSAVYSIEGTSSGVSSNFDWKLTSGSGYFHLTPSATDEKVLTTTVAAQSTTITAADAGEIYAKVSLSADNTLSGISLYKVKTDGTLEEVKSLADDQKVNVVITAPADKITVDLSKSDFKIANSVQIVGAAAESDITLRKGDSLTTADLTARSKTISVNGTAYQAGGNTVLKFTNDGTATVLTNGIVELTNGKNFNAAGADSAAATDNVAVSFTGAAATTTTPAESAIVTVVSGVVTDIVGNGTVKVGGATYTYNKDIKGYNVTAPTMSNGNVFTTAKLAKGATIAIGGTTYKSGAADNRVTFRNESGTNKLFNGTVTLLTQANSLTVSDGDEKTADDIRVTYTASKATAGNGTATVEVVNGKIQSITGLQADETLTVTDNSVDGTTTTTTYEATAIGVKRTVVTQVGTADPVTVTDNATLLAGGDLLTANYYSGTTGDAGTALVGQFNWSTDIAGRSIGYFAATVNKDGVFVKTETVNDQAKEVVISAPKKGEKTYLVASAQSDGAETPSSVLALGNLLTIDATGKVTTTELNKSTLPETGVIAIKAPAGKITFVKPATNLKVNLTNLAADSTVSGLIKGDTVDTATLAAGESVTVGGQAYTAAAKGVLKFIGEGAVTANEGTVTASETDVSGAALLSGVVNLAAGKSAKLAGGAAKTELGASDDITVTNNSTAADNVVVKVTNGVVSSITGLTSGTVTVANATWKSGAGKNATELSGATIVYTALGSNMYKREVFKDGTTGTAGVYDDGDTNYEVSFLTAAKAGGEIYTGAYKPASYTPLSDLNFSNTGAKKTTTAYYKLATANTAADATTMVTSTTAADLKDTVNGNTFLAEPGAKYMVVTATTTAAGVTTINSVDGYEAGATGKLTKNAKLISSYTGTLTIDGKQGMSTNENATYDEKYAVINYTLTKNGTFDVVAENVSYKSKFTNLGEGDMVTTAAIENTALSSGTYNIYHGVAATTETKAYTEARTIAVKTGKNDNVVVSTSATDGTITKLTGLATKGEQVTVTELTAAGLATTVYAVTAAGVVTRTRTLADGTKSVAVTTKAVTGETDFATLVADEDWTSTTSNTIASDFDWTLYKSGTGYFKVANNAATAKVQKTAIKANDTSSYIAVQLSGNGEVASIQQVRYNAETGTMTATEDQFSGKLTLTAPTAYALSFDRDGKNIDTNAVVAIKGAITGSALSNLANNDTVTTAKLKKGEYVAINNEYYKVAGNGGVLGFKVQDVSINGEDKTSKVTLTSGTALLNNGYGTEAGDGFIYVGNSDRIELGKENPVTGAVPTTVTSITVTATTNAKGVTSFTIGDLDENESFTLNGYTYMKSGTNLVRSYNDSTGQVVTEIYANNGAKTVTSANLNKAANWKPAVETLVDNDGALTSNYGIVTANLALADSRFAADKKAAKVANNADFGYDDNYKYVLDRYVKSGTNPSATKPLNGYVVSSAADWQTAIGQVTMKQIFTAIANTTTYTYHYLANSAIGQAIKVAANWMVEGSNYDDTITGATKGTDFIRAGKGNDTIALGGAADTVAFNLNEDGQNVVTGYGFSKDAIYFDDATRTTTDNVGTLGTVGGDFAIALGTTKADSGSVYLYKDANGDGSYNAVATDTADAENSVMLKGVGVGKAVTINDRHFYFGNGYTSTKGATFAYEEGAYYVGNTSKKNGLKVTTDKTKYTAKTLGDDVVVDLMAVDSEDHRYYTNINTVDASASANRVVLSASTESGAEITLKGGTYQSTLKSGASNDSLVGGKGQDMFWFDNLGGSDTISSYTSGRANKDNDAIYVNGSTDLTGDGYTVKASGNDVIISSGDNQVKLAGAAKWSATKAITVSKDGKINGESVSYYVGKSGNVSNNFTYAEGAYYIGNSETKDATLTETKYLDTLKVTGTVKTAVKAEDKLNIDMSTGNQYQSIEAIDASGRKVARNVDSTNAGVNVTASAKGTRFTGTAYADTFNCGDGKDYIIYAKNAGNDTITGFGVGDVVQLNGLTKAEIANLSSQINKINSAGGTGKLTIGNSSLSFSNAATLSIDSKGKISGVSNS